MPRFLESKLKAEYPGNNHAVYGVMNKIGAMKGNKVTPKGERMQAQHDAKVAHPHANLGKYLHKSKKG